MAFPDDEEILFYDLFEDLSLDTDKWNINAINTITYSVDGRLVITDSLKSDGTYWIYDSTDNGSQHQAKFTIPTDPFQIEWQSKISDTSAAQMGQAGVGIVKSNNTFIVWAGHEDEMGDSISPQLRLISEANWVNVAGGWSGSGTKTLTKSISSGDTNTFKILKNGTTVSVYVDNVKIADTTISSTVSKAVIGTGGYGGYSFLNYVNFNYFIATKPPTEYILNVGDSSNIKSLITVNTEDYSDWLWQNEIEITGSVDGQLTDYPVNITIPYDSEFMRYDFLDIRFGTDYGLNLPYFVRQQVDGDYAEFIVKIPVIPASPDSVIIYAYAGNDQASDQSNGFNVFSLFDDFEEDYTVGVDTSKWAVDGIATITDGILNIHADLPMNHTHFSSKTSYGENYILGMRAKCSVPGTSSYISFGFDDNSTRYMKEYITPTNSEFNVNDAGSEDTGSNHRSTYTPTTYYVYEIEHKAGLDITENINFTPVETSPVSITTPVEVRFLVSAYAAAQDLWVDYVYVRKSICNEPYIGELGTWSTTTHTDIYQATLWVPYTHDTKALICIRPLREDFQVLLNILGYDEKDIKFLLNIAEDKNYNYIKFVQALVEVTDDAWYLDSQALISIGNVTTGTLEVKGKILYHPNSNTTIIEGLAPSADDKAQFVMKIGGRIYG